MDQSELLTSLVVRGATLLLAVLLARLIAALALAALARISVDPVRRQRLTALAVGVGPHFARAAVVLTAGAGIALLPSVATATPIAPAVPPPTSTVVGAPHVPLLDRVVDAGGPAATDSKPHTAPPTRARSTPPKTPPRAPAARTHVVRAGESLWSIAAASIGVGAADRDIARSWPRWYTANSTLVGDDPGLLRPGQVLRAPSAGSSR